MNNFQYGGINQDIKQMSNDANKVSKKQYQRKRSLNINHLIEDLNDAFAALSKTQNLQTLREHLKAVSVFLIFISTFGILLLQNF